MKYLDWILSVILVGLAVAAVITFATSRDTVDVNKADSTVKIEIVGSGHGSGTHIGNGLILTAAHVVDSEGEFKVVTTTGQELDAEVLWFNTARDLAMVKVADYSQIGDSPVDCRTASVGEQLTFEGNPLGLTFQTTVGTVTGALISNPEAERWIESLPVDGVIAPGMSGGGVFDADGDLVGVNVAGILMPIGMMDYSTSGFNLIVPSSTFCAMMGTQ